VDEQTGALTFPKKNQYVDEGKCSKKWDEGRINMWTRVSAQRSGTREESICGRGKNQYVDEGKCSKKWDEGRINMWTREESICGRA
jgi:hypothetical protein